MAPVQATGAAPRSGDARIAAAVVGYGVSGRVFHAPLIEADDAYRLCAIVTSDPGRQRHAREHHDAALVLPTFEALLAAIDGGLALDVAVLGTPPAVHREQALALMERGIGAVVDKPFAPSAQDARRMIEASERTGSLLTVFQNRRWDGDFATVQRLLADGVLGTVQTFESRFEWFSGRAGGWKESTPVASGGGILLDVGSHLVDQAIQLFGPVEEASAELVRHSASQGPDEDAFVSLLHGSGVRTRLWMNSKAPAEGPRFHVVGDRAAFTCHGKDPQEAALGAGASPSDPGYGERSGTAAGTVHTGTTADVPTAEAGNYPAFYRLLARALSGAGPAPVDPAEALEVLTLLEDLHARHPVRCR